MKRADTGLMVLIAVVGTLFLATGLLHGLPAMKAVVGADCILRGDMPYRDFWTMYAPGQFYAVAALFALFGRVFMVQGAVAVLLGGVSAAVLFRILRRLDVGRWTGAALAVAFLAMIWTPGPELTSYPPALLLILLSLDRIVSYLRGAGPGPLFRAGLMLGAAAIFKHDVAAYVAMGFAVSIILGWFALTSRRPAAWIHPARSISRVACGAILVALPVVVWLGVVSGKEAWRHLIVFPLTDFPEVRGEGYPSLIPALTGLSIFLESPIRPAAALHVLGRLSSWAFGLVPIVVLVATASCLALRARMIESGKLAVTILCLVLILPFFAAAHVQQNTHLFSMAVLSMLLFGMAWSTVRARAARVALLAFALVMLMPMVAIPMARMYRGAWVLRDGTTLEFPGVWGIKVSPEEAEYYVPIVSFLRRHIPPDEPIYVGVQRHDAIVISNQKFYFLADRRSCCGHYELHPGVIDREDVQREIIKSIQDSGVRCVVLWHFGWPKETLDRIRDRNRSATDGLGGSVALDRFISEEFEEIARYGEYGLLWLRGAERPPGW